MYFGSVKFFKHLILATIVIVILALTISILYLILTNKSYQEQIDNFKAAPILSHEMKPIDQPSEPIEYQNLFPELNAILPLQYLTDKHTVYLTFDDGPSDRTTEILDILKENNIKATFFIIGKENEKENAIMKRIVD